MFTQVYDSFGLFGVENTCCYLDSVCIPDESMLINVFQLYKAGELDTA